MASTATAPQNQPVKRKVDFEFSYVFVLGDLAIRYIFLAFWRFAWISASLFWIAQLIVIPAAVAFILDRHRTAVAKKNDLQDSQLNVKDATHWPLVTLLLMIHGGFQTFWRVGFTLHWLHTLVAILITIAYATYIMVIAVVSVSNTRSYISVAPATSDLVDENDRRLIRLKIEIATFERKVESYTIESTLIGGLAFSAFVTIISSDKSSAGGVSYLLKNIFSLFRSVLTADFASLRAMVPRLPDEHTVLAVVACLAVICSMFFLAVIVARLRFNALVGLASYSTQMAEAFNEKEEHMVRNLALSPNLKSKETDARLNAICKQITESLDDAQVVVDQLRPIIHYMGGFRHIGVLCFLSALVASAWWISPVLALGFTVVGLIAYGYPTFDRWARDGRLYRHASFRLPQLLKLRR